MTTYKPTHIDVREWCTKSQFRVPVAARTATRPEHPNKQQSTDPAHTYTVGGAGAPATPPRSCAAPDSVGIEPRELRHELLPAQLTLATASADGAGLALGEACGAALPLPLLWRQVALLPQAPWPCHTARGGRRR